MYLLHLWWQLKCRDIQYKCWIFSVHSEHILMSFTNKAVLMSPKVNKTLTPAVWEPWACCPSAVWMGSVGHLFLLAACAHLSSAGGPGWAGSRKEIPPAFPSRGFSQSWWFLFLLWKATGNCVVTVWQLLLGNLSAYCRRLAFVLESQILVIHKKSMFFFLDTWMVWVQTQPEVFAHNCWESEYQKCNWVLDSDFTEFEL